MIQAKLLVIGGEAEAEEITLQLPAIVGRSRDALINLSHPLVSRQHCELFEANGKLMVRDLDSLNGTFVGSRRISESVLQPGDLLTVGTVTFRALYEPGASDGSEDGGEKVSRQRPRKPSKDDPESEETHRLGEKDTLEVQSTRPAGDAQSEAREDSARPAPTDN